jgi:uncharacterized protein YjbJ (UPF0337 family)
MNTNLNEKLQQAVSKAKEVWTDLTAEEMKKAEDGLHHLKGMMHEKYHETRDDAQKRLHDFLEKHHLDKRH